MRRIAVILILLWFSRISIAGDRGYDRGFNGSLGAVLGQHFTGKICAPNFFPTLEFRTGYRVSRTFTLRLDLGVGMTQIGESDRQSFEGAGYMVGHASMVFLYTPDLSEHLHLNLGAALGLWFSAMWGDDLMGAMAGSVQKYLEALSISYAAVAGIDWDLSEQFALVFELRANMAMATFGREYNTGGVTLMAGFLYRVRPYNP